MALSEVLHCRGTSLTVWCILCTLLVHVAMKASALFNTIESTKAVFANSYLYSKLCRGSNSWLWSKFDWSTNKNRNWVFEWFRNDLKQTASKSHVMLTTDYMVQVNAEGNKLSFGGPKVAHVDYVKFTCLK